MLPIPEITVGEAGEIPADEFAAIVQSYRPLVIRQLVRRWPAVLAARRGDAAIVDYLGGLDSGAVVDLMVGPPAIGGRFFYDDDFHGFNFDRRAVALRPLLAELLRIADMPDPPALYAGAAGTGELLPGFARDNPLPLPTPGAEPRIWIGNRTRVATHFDVSENIACVVGGTRSFTLFPPQQVANLYVGPLETTMAGQPASLVDPVQPDYERFPRYHIAEAAAMRADLEPGDAIFIPSLWWHHIEAHDRLNILVNYWWGQKDEASAFAALIHALLAVRDVSTAERNGWRSFFEHYVFGDDAVDAGAHIPEHARGVLGPPSPSRTQLIVGFLRRALDRAVPR